MLSTWYQTYAQITKNKDYSTDDYVVSKAVFKNIDKGVQANTERVLPIAMEILTLNGKEASDEQILKFVKEKFDQAKVLFKRGNPNLEDSKEVLDNLIYELQKDRIFDIKRDRKPGNYIPLD